jgi:hypothetical protein
VSVRECKRGGEERRGEEEEGEKKEENQPFSEVKLYKYSGPNYNT